MIDKIKLEDVDIKMITKQILINIFFIWLPSVWGDILIIMSISGLGILLVYYFFNVPLALGWMCAIVLWNAWVWTLLALKG